MCFLPNKNVDEADAVVRAAATWCLFGCFCSSDINKYCAWPSAALCWTTLTRALCHSHVLRHFLNSHTFVLVSMTAEPDALAVVNQLRDLAADPMNRRAIVQDQGCLPGLILFLDHPNPQVVYSALLVSSQCACQEVKDPVLKGWLHPEWAPSVYQLLGDVVLNAELSCSGAVDKASSWIKRPRG
uniref:Armadillo repeat-containing protein 1 n=1 Tax=Neolamprologus brichardi TaxID=32507 RepID=A0A3Q4HLM3_NEOBR